MIIVHSLVYQPRKSVNAPPFHFMRQPATSLNLVAGFGIEGDMKGGHNPRRQVNILSYETVEIMRAEGFKTAAGQLGEQIVIAGLDVSSLPFGSCLQLGESARLQINSLREGCEWFELVQGKLLTETQCNLGVLASVVSSGIVHVGDVVTLVQKDAPA